MTIKLPVEHPVSAGGVVYRLNGDILEVLLCGRTESSSWNLPKGTPEPDESLSETAKREVQEETGLDVVVDKLIGFIRYWFIRDGVKYHKTVYFFLMEPTGGSIEQHDREFDIVEWFPVKEAYLRLTFKNELRILKRVASMIETNKEEWNGRDNITG